MNREKITTIIAAILGIFILLAGLLFLNSYLNGKNSAIFTKNIQNNPKNIIATHASSTAVQNISNVTSTAAESSTPVNKDIIKKMVQKDLDSLKKTPVKTAAEIYGNVEACAALKTAADQKVCYSLWAEDDNDPGVCAQAPDTVRQDCQDRAYIVKAQADKDISLCAKIIAGDAQTTCIMKVTIAAGLGEKDCSTLSGDLGKICLTDVILAKAKSAADCNNITDAGIKQACRDNFYADLKTN